MLTHLDRGLGRLAGPGSLTLVLRGIGFQCRHSHSPPLPAPTPWLHSPSHQCFCLLTLFHSYPQPPTPPLALLSLFHSPNINRVIWMSYIAGKLWWCQLLCVGLWMAVWESSAKCRYIRMTPAEVFLVTVLWRCRSTTTYDKHYNLPD